MHYFVMTTKHATGGCGGKGGGFGGRITREEDIAFSTEVQNKFSSAINSYTNVHAPHALNLRASKTSKKQYAVHQLLKLDF